MGSRSFFLILNRETGEGGIVTSSSGESSKESEPELISMTSVEAGFDAGEGLSSSEDSELYIIRRDCFFRET